MAPSINSQQLSFNHTQGTLYPSPISRLPDNLIIEKILTLLKISQLVSFGLVNKHFRQLSFDARLWQISDLKKSLPNFRFFTEPEWKRYFTLSNKVTFADCPLDGALLNPLISKGFKILKEKQSDLQGVYINILQIPKGLTSSSMMQYGASPKMGKATCLNVDSDTLNSLNGYTVPKTYVIAVVEKLVPETFFAQKEIILQCPEPIEMIAHVITTFTSCADIPYREDQASITCRQSYTTDTGNMTSSWDLTVYLKYLRNIGCSRRSSSDEPPVFSIIPKTDLPQYVGVIREK